jgi:Cupin
MPILMMLALALTLASPLLGQEQLPAVDVTAADVEAFIDALPRDAVSDRPMRVVDLGGHRVGIYGVYRPQSVPGGSIVHNTDVAEIYYILEGAGTLVTGGSIPEARDRSGSIFDSDAGQRIEGGTSRRVTTGDIVVIPGGVPHWWSVLEGNLSYLIFRPDPSEVQPLR